MVANSHPLLPWSADNCPTPCQFFNPFALNPQTPFQCLHRQHQQHQPSLSGSLPAPHPSNHAIKKHTKIGKMGAFAMPINKNSQVFSFCYALPKKSQKRFCRASPVVSESAVNFVVLNRNRYILILRFRLTIYNKNNVECHGPRPMPKDWYFF